MTKTLSLKRLTRFMAGDSEKSQLAKHSVILQATAVAVLAVAFIQSVVVTRYLGVYNFGLISLVTAFVAIVNQIADFRVWELISNYAVAAIVRKDIAGARAILQLAFLISFVAGVLAAAVCVFMASLLTVTVWHQPQLTAYLILFALSASWAAQVQNMSALLRVAGAYKALASIRVLLALAGLLAVSLVAIGDFGLSGMFVAYSGIALCSAVFGFFVSLIASRRMLGQSFWAADLKMLKVQSGELLRFVGSTWLSGSLRIVVGQADEFILGVVGSPAVVGVYRVTKNFGRLALSLSDPVYEVIYPQLSRLWTARSYRAIRSMVFAVLGVGMAFIAVAIPLSIGVGSQVISIIYGQQFVPGGLLVGLIMLNALYIPSLWCGPLFRVSGRINVSLRIETAVSFISLTLMVLLIPHWEVYGAAIGFVAYSVIYSLIAGAYFWKQRRFYFSDRRLV